MSKPYNFHIFNYGELIKFNSMVDHTNLFEMDPPFFTRLLAVFHFPSDDVIGYAIFRKFKFDYLAKENRYANIYCCHQIGRHIWAVHLHI